MQAPEFDIAIAGAGPVGSALALLLARHAPRPERILLVGAPFLDSAPPAPQKAPDPRSLAMNHGSRSVLEQLGAWPAHSASIETVHVSQRGRLGRTVIRHDEMGVPRLGSVVAYHDLLACLHAAVRHCGVTMSQASQAYPLIAQHVHLQVDGRDISSAVTILSDGSRPSGLRREYNQHAVLTTVRASQPQARWAFERFTDQGPLALLPHPDGPDRYGVVWCCAPQHAEALRRLDPPAFNQALSRVFGDRLGRLECQGLRHVFPLSLNAGPQLLNPRTVAIGNAAQTLHPVAGQGLNLGLRDAVQLSQALAPWLVQPGQAPGPLLESFARRRKADRWLTTGITDFLPRIFSTRNPLVEHCSGIGLLAMDLIPPLRASLGRHLMQGLRV